MSLVDKALADWQSIQVSLEKIGNIQLPEDASAIDMNRLADELNLLTENLKRTSADLQILMAEMTDAERADFDMRTSTVPEQTVDRCAELISGKLPFSDLTLDEKRDKKFISECLERGVDPRMLQHVSPYVLFTHYPSDDEDENLPFEWHKGPAKFDTDFFKHLCKLTEHTFWNFWINPEVELLVGNDFDKFDLWDNEEAWLAAVENPKFIKYFSDLELQEIIDEWDGFPDLQKAIRAQISSINDDLKTFAATILDEYFGAFSSTYIEESYGIDLGDEYLSAVVNNNSDQLVLEEEPDSDDIYGLSNLSEFEALVAFVNKNAGN